MGFQSYARSATSRRVAALRWYASTHRAPLQQCLRQVLGLLPYLHELRIGRGEAGSDGVDRSLRAGEVNANGEAAGGQRSRNTIGPVSFTIDGKIPTSQLRVRMWLCAPVFYARAVPALGGEPATMSDRQRRTQMVERVLKGDWQALVGQTIEAVVVCRDDRTRRSHIHLVFSNKSNFEIYAAGESFAGSSGLYNGDLAAVLKANYVGECQNLAVYKAPNETP